MSAAGDLRAIVAEAERAFAAAASPQELIEARAGFLGKKGSISAVLRGLGSLAADQRATLGAAANEAKQRIETLASERKLELERAGQAEALTAGRLDVTLPAAGSPRGRMHPVSVIERDVAAFFSTLGYSIEDGPEVETEWNNFGALNFPEDHPARDLQDTLFVEGGHVLRTHTSPVQVRAMTGREPPFRFVVPGRVYRHDFDATHSPMFHQIEAFLVDRHVTLAHLKGVLAEFAERMYGPGTPVRLRPSYFPFVEPGAEVDIGCVFCKQSDGTRVGCSLCKHTGFIEVLGCGMIHPVVLENCGIDPDAWSGFALGMGLERIAMLRYGIPNIKLMFDNDPRFLAQF
jgi:phenylalanyl-tRNA synthetase alpha chain